MNVQQWLSKWHNFDSRAAIYGWERYRLPEMLLEALRPPYPRFCDAFDRELIAQDLDLRRIHDLFLLNQNNFLAPPASSPSSMPSFLGKNDGKTDRGRSRSRDTLRQSNSRDSSQNRNRSPKPCLCGQKHSWKRCFFLNPDVRPKSWRPREKLLRTFNNALKQLDKAQKERIERVIRKSLPRP